MPYAFARTFEGFHLHDLHVYDVCVVFAYLRLSSNLGSHFLAAVSAVFNFTKEPCPVFACNFLKSRYILGDFVKNDFMKSYSFALLFKIWKVVTYTAFSYVRLKSIILPGYCSLISAPMTGGMLLSFHKIEGGGEICTDYVLFPILNLESCISVPLAPFFFFSP